jgi:hypothetical protein
LSIIVPFEPDDLSDWFWDILQRANKEPSKLKDILQNLSNDELQRFALEFMDAASNLRQEPYTNYYQASEDSTADMSYWVVSQGTLVFAHSMAARERLW